MVYHYQWKTHFWPIWIQEIFRAGETDKGTVYLVGGDMGVEGRLSTIDDGMLIIYSGFCSIGFG